MRPALLIGVLIAFRRAEEDAEGGGPWRFLYLRRMSILAGGIATLLDQRIAEQKPPTSL